jgi:hypothetical protein
MLRLTGAGDSPYDMVMHKSPEGMFVVRKKPAFIAATALLVLIAAVVITVLVVHRSDGGGSDARETQEIVQLVGKHFDLPTTEQPTVAKIQDKSKLADQQFFVRAQNGDYLLVYNTEKLALIYRKSADKLINVGPVNFDTQQSVKDTPAQPVQ